MSGPEQQQAAPHQPPRLMFDGPHVHLEASAVSLRELIPVVDGRALHRAPRVERRAHGWLLGYDEADSGGSSVEIDVLQECSGFALRVRVRPGPETSPPDAFGVRFEQVLNVRQYLRQGYHSWDGSGFVTPGDAPARPGYAVTQLLPNRGSGAVVLGFDRHDRYQHTFTFEPHGGAQRLTVLTLWDRKEPRSQPCESEWLLIFEHPEVEGGLRAWAQRVADASPVPPRAPQPSITGWCSWYNLYAAITEENILEHLRDTAAVTRRERLPMRVFQIDDGFTPEMGDWLDVKPQFPRGMKPLLDDIRAEGFTPGLWIAPFMVGNRSRLYRAHPDWVIRDREMGGPLVQERFYGEFRWHKRSEEYYILDTTHPDAFAYLREVFRTWRHDWGCEYFKTDFMFFGAEHGPDRAVRHQEGRTRIEIWRDVAQMIRDEIGEALWLNCGAPLWASVGLVDAIRTGRDVGVQWHATLNAHERLENLAVRNFANHLLWQADPDCILLRERHHHLSEAELTALALYAGMTGGVTVTSDNLAELSPGRLDLWRLVLAPTAQPCRFPLLGGPEFDPVFVQVRAAGDVTAVFLFNSGEETLRRQYRLETLQLPALYARAWPDADAGAGRVDTLDVELRPHSGQLFFLSADPRSADPRSADPRSAEALASLPGRLPRRDASSDPRASVGVPSGAGDTTERSGRDV